MAECFQLKPPTSRRRRPDGCRVARYTNQSDQNWAKAEIIANRDRRGAWLMTRRSMRTMSRRQRNQLI
jgi:hypothetical protein